jgi:peptidoglycan/LPS O-acetylase OafA/YrhL
VKDRLGVLDGMRGIAVLLVLWYHIWEISWLPAPFHWLQWIPETGFIGVPLFFFLSGFVITFPFVRAQIAGERLPTWGHFAWRRFIKIVPSYLLSIAIAYAIGYAASERSGATAWEEVVTHLLFIHTWWQSTYGSINGVLWTLAIEVEFYLVFPLVWWCFSRRPFLTFGAMIALAMLWRVHAAQCCFAHQMPLLVENLPGYIDIFACGMLSAWIFARFGHRLRAPRISIAMPLVAIAGAALFCSLLIGMFNDRASPQWEVALQIYTRPLFGLSFGAVALGSLAAPARWQALLANAPLRFMAFISYNLYLYHQMIARLMVRAHIPPFVGHDPHGDPVWQVRYTILAFAFTIAQAALVTYLFERPLLRLPQPRLLIPARGHSP